MKSTFKYNVILMGQQQKCIYRLFLHQCWSNLTQRFLVAFLKKFDIGNNDASALNCDFLVVLAYDIFLALWKSRFKEDISIVVAQYLFFTRASKHLCVKYDQDWYKN